MFTEFISHIKSTKEAFSYVKQDILNLWGHIQHAGARVQSAEQRLEALQEKITNLQFEISLLQKPQLVEQKEVIKVVPVEKKHDLIANTASGKIHDESCVFARQILPEHRVIVDSLTHATSKGYDTCVCLEA